MAQGVGFQKLGALFDSLRNKEYGMMGFIFGPPVYGSPHKSMRILQTLVSGIPLVLGLEQECGLLGP